MYAATASWLIPTAISCEPSLRDDDEGLGFSLLDLQDMLEEETERKETTLDVIKRMRRESAEVRQHQRDKRQERKREQARATAERGKALGEWTGTVACALARAIRVNVERSGYVLRASAGV